jgi:hypothetical protein
MAVGSCRHAALRFAATLAVALGGIWGAAASGAEACDRVCLEGFVDRYLEALVARDAAGLPLAANAKLTENGQTLTFSDALWGTASKDSTYRLYVTDPVTGQAAFLGLLEENGEPVVLGLRLRIRDRQITEVEHIVARLAAGGLGNAAAMVEPFPILTAAVPPEQRSPRAEMIAIADSYFDGLDELDSGRLVPFDDECRRRENGVETANAQDPAATGMRAMGCAEQFNTGFSKFITDIRERRFPVVDEERGLVYAVIFFDHAGTVKTVQLTNGETMQVAPNYQRPLTWMIGEVFKIQQGRIRQIEAVLVGVPYRMPSGW